MALVPLILIACFALGGCATARPCDCCARADLPLAAFDLPSTKR